MRKNHQPAPLLSLAYHLVFNARVRDNFRTLAGVKKLIKEFGITGEQKEVLLKRDFKGVLKELNTELKDLYGGDDKFGW